MYDGYSVKPWVCSLIAIFLLKAMQSSFFKTKFVYVGCKRCILLEYTATFHVQVNNFKISRIKFKREN